MSQQQTPLAIGLAFTQAWTSHDMDTAASYVAHDIVFDGPMNHTTGDKAYMEALTRFASTVTGLKILAAFGDDQQALIMYEVTTTPFGPIPSAELLTIKDGKIQADRLIFDTSKMRNAATSLPQSAGTGD
ncbi:MAG TPA: nuclear transport factor 2 family protein [Ktedonobacterales bacterium]